MPEGCEATIAYFEENFSDNINYDEFFNALSEMFLKDKVSGLFSYILKNKTDYKLLNALIRYINKYRHAENLPDLLDFIVSPVSDSKLLDTKVLAIKTISVFKDTVAVQALLFCLNDKNSNYKIRLASAEALGKIGDVSAFESLGKIASDSQEKSVYVRESAATALGMLGDNRALDIFSSIIETKQMFLDKFSYLKEKIIEAMSKLDFEKNNKAYKVLKSSLMDTSPNVRIAAIEAIMNSNISEAYELIFERLQYDDNVEVRKNALVALYNISDKTILNTVINSDYPDELKIYAKELLVEYEND